MSTSPRVGISVSLPADLLIATGEQADRLHVNRSAVIAMALAKFLKPEPVVIGRTEDGEPVFARTDEVVAGTVGGGKTKFATPETPQVA